MPNLRIPLPDLVLKAVIICDDFAFAAKANATLRRVIPIGFSSARSVRNSFRAYGINE
jgi:hypothetical protein